MCIADSVINLLDVQGVKYKCESASVAAHAAVKSVVVEGDRTKTRWVCVTPADRQFDAKKFEALVGEPVRFANSREDALGLPADALVLPDEAVPPFGSLLALKTYCDRRLAESEVIGFIAGTMTETFTMPNADYERIEKPILVDITE